MKNIILGIFGCLMVIQILCIGVSIYTKGTRQNELSNVFSSVLKQTLENYYIADDLRSTAGQIAQQEEIYSAIKEEMKLRISTDCDISIEILVCDMDKGILSARANASYVYPTGNRENYQISKTVLMDRDIAENTQAEVLFYVSGELYKKYQITIGEPVILPKQPAKDGVAFVGWQQENTGAWYQGQLVEGDVIWNAVFQ